MRTKKKANYVEMCIIHIYEYFYRKVCIKMSMLPPDMAVVPRVQGTFQQDVSPALSPALRQLHLPKVLGSYSLFYRSQAQSWQVSVWARPPTSHCREQESSMGCTSRKFKENLRWYPAVLTGMTYSSLLKRKFSFSLTKELTSWASLSFLCVPSKTQWDVVVSWLKRIRYRSSKLSSFLLEKTVSGVSEWKKCSWVCKAAHRV